MNYKYKDVEPLTALDLQEISYLADFHSRMNSIPRVISQNQKNRNFFDSIVFIQKWAKKYNPRFPLGSRRRLYAKKIAYMLPMFVQNAVVGSLSPQFVNSDSPVSVSLDLGFGIKTSAVPKVSIVIPVYDGVWITYRCLRALQRNRDQVPFEIIIVDDASNDQTKDLLRNIRGVRVIRNVKNLGYLLSTNLGASHARGEYIALLNNDTEPVSGWLDNLFDLLENDSTIAIAGSTLIFNDGRLQESGGQIFSNANAWNLGRGSDPKKAEFRFVREVDYCSAASILVRGDFWKSINGFDERYIPAYCEDSDLALSAWNEGHRVVVCPTSWVIHHEGSSHGNSTDQGTKKYQILNTKKLFSKWESQLRSHWDDQGIPRLESARNSKGIIIVCDRQAPSSIRDAGSVRTLQLMRHMRLLGYHVIFSAIDFSTNEVELSLLEKEGVEIHRTKESLINSLEIRASRIKLFWLIRSEVYDFYQTDLTKLGQEIPTVADLIDLKYERKKNSFDIDEHQAEIAGKVALTLFCSNVESELLKNIKPDINIGDLWAEYEAVEVQREWSDTRGLLFVGGFRHQPNVDALKHFVQKILPEIRSEHPTMEVNIVGTGLEISLIDMLEKNGVHYLGRVDDLGSMYLRSRVVIAPLVSGGGRKGKIGEALAWGVPVVTTKIGEEGFNFQHGLDAFISDDPKEFAQYAISLETDQKLWEKSSAAAYNYAKTNLSSKAFGEKIEEILINTIGVEIE